MMKKAFMVMGLAVMGLVATSTAAVANSDDGVDALAEAYLKEHPSKAENYDNEPVKKDLASGFWTCNGIGLHMGVDMKSWQDLNTGDMYVFTEKSPVDDKDKNEKIKGIDYLYSWTKNPAVIKYFIVDKTGKNLYIRDDLKFFKTYKCKRN
ncbi:hypothetical protein LT980_09290 [Citrobacter portucalensis]|uniref:hypothetical protein n=1 Tax=Citrobacter portucalensis TaxID=1639133 RepID=UPI00202D0130|nr:hypothetical protein [Citrobacter portucalensis]URR14757.1 hypothetical protein LT980_09290 [Citrobacter portucalensis]